MWELYSAYRGNFFFFNIHQIFLQKYPKCHFWFLNSQQQMPSPARASLAVPHVPLAQWASCTRQPFGTHAHLHSLYVVTLVSPWWPHWQADFWRKSSRKSWLRTFNMSYFAWVAAETGTADRQRRLLSTAFPGFRRRCGHSSEDDPPPSFNQCSRRAASFQHLEYTPVEFLLFQTDIERVDAGGAEEP